MDFHLSTIFIFISLIVSITLYFQRSVPFYLKPFPLFLFLSLVVEIIGTYLSAKDLPNVHLFSFFMVFEFEFYIYILRIIVQRVNAKRTISYLLWIYPLLALINSLFIQVNIFHSISWSIGCLLIVSICIYYFFELFQLPKATNLIRDPAFWICSGLLFFYCCSFPLFGLLNLLYTVPDILLRNMFAILQFLNVLLYTSFSIAFLCRIRFEKRHSGPIS